MEENLYSDFQSIPEEDIHSLKNVTLYHCPDCGTDFFYDGVARHFEK